MFESLEEAFKRAFGRHRWYLASAGRVVRLMVLRRMLRGESYRGDRVVSTSSVRFGAYSYRYGLYKKRLGLDYRRYTLFLSGFFHSATYPDARFEMMTLPGARWFLLKNRRVAPNYVRLARLSHEEKEMAVKFYAEEFFREVAAAF